VDILATDPRTDTIFVGDAQENFLWAINGRTYTKTKFLDGDCCGQNSMAVDPATDTLYTVGTDDGLYAISGRTHTVTGFPLATPGEVVVNPVTDTLYVSSVYDNTLSVVDGRTHMVRAVLGFGTTAIQDVTVNPRTNTVYLTDDSTLYAIDGRSNTVTATRSVEAGSGGLGVDPLTDTLYFQEAATTSAGNATRVMAVDGRTLRLRGQALLGDVGQMWVNPSNETIFFLGFSGVLTAIDGQTFRVTASLSLGPSGWLAGDPVRGRLYVTSNSVNPVVTVIQT